MQNCRLHNIYDKIIQQFVNKNQTVFIAGLCPPGFMQ